MTKYSTRRRKRQRSRPAWARSMTPNEYAQLVATLQAYGAEQGIKIEVDKKEGQAVLTSPTTMMGFSLERLVGLCKYTPPEQWTNVIDAFIDDGLAVMRSVKHHCPICQQEEAS
ncbi:MAG: hypothetical protein ACFFDI_20855 [Promethearchaeota archaeon]